jgi:hypothetical protein
MSNWIATIEDALEMRSVAASMTAIADRVEAALVYPERRPN